MPQDEVTGLSLKLTEEDIRQDCKAMGIPYSALHAVGRRLRAQNTATQMSDVLYVMILAKSRGLNPVADNYSLIPRPDDKGFSTTFNKEAALHVINLHPKVKKGSIARRIIVTGKGDRIDLNENPEKVPGRWKLADIDWEMTAIYEVDAEAGGVLRGFAKYKNCVAVGHDGNPKFLWLKDPCGMTMKQAAKDLANTHLDGSLPDEDAIEAAQQAELPSAPADQRSLPASTNGTPSPSDAEERIVDEAAKMGINREKIITAFRGEEAHGVSAEAFLEKLKKDVADREAAAKPKTRKARSSPKPEIATKGTIDAIAERKREGTGQDYLDIEVGGEKYFVWDKNLFEAAWKAMEDRIEVTLKYTLSGDEGFKEVKSLVLPEPPVEQDAAAGEVTETEAEKQPETTPELPKEEAPTPEVKKTKGDYLF